MRKTKKVKIKFISQIKWRKVVLKITHIIIILIILYHLLYLVSTSLTKKGYLQLGDLSFFCMENDMMMPEVKKNDLVIIKNTKEISIGENIAYYVSKENIRINKLVKINDKEGKVTYVTKSNNAYYFDREEITQEEIIGKEQYCIPFLGAIAKALQSKAVTVLATLYLAIKLWYNKYMQKQIARRKQKKETIKQ